MILLNTSQIQTYNLFLVLFLMLLLATLYSPLHWWSCWKMFRAQALEFSFYIPSTSPPLTFALTRLENLGETKRNYSSHTSFSIVSIFDCLYICGNLGIFSNVNGATGCIIKILALIKNLMNNFWFQHEFTWITVISHKVHLSYWLISALYLN